MKYMNFFFSSLKVSLSQQMVYKANYFIRTLTLMGFDMVLPFVTILIYLNTKGFNGWSFDEIILFQGIFILVNALDRFFFRRANWFLSNDIRNGNFDRYLLYPVNVLAYVSFTHLAPEQAAQVVVGIAVIIYSLVKLSVSLTVMKVIGFFLFLALAMVLLLSLQIFQYAVILRAVMMGRMGEFIMTLKRYGEYPVEIYGGALSSVLRYVLPLSVLAYVPSNVLLSKASENYFFIGIIIVAIFFLSYSFWLNSLRNYTSAGG
ncbi:ABC-2 family transporter protein [Candidatus Woesearchaeota archaeon]|nr:ABC-2 family transporter protein [Candidatus Woesearchaeota archaeon]